MSLQSKRMGILFVFALFVLACYSGVVTPQPPMAATAPVYDPTKAALEFQATMMSQQLTQAALDAQSQAQQPPAQPSPLPPQATSAPLPTEIPPTPTEDLDAKIKSANVLVYENTDALGIGMWVQEALDNMGMTYTQTGSYSGRFFEQLNSGKNFDLIIVDAEDQSAVRGEFWDVINTRLVRDKAALIVEVWYLDRVASGSISQILSKCGVSYQKDYNLADSIYWWESDHPIFNEPNTVLPLLHYSRYWSAQAGDQIRLSGGGDAILLAGLSARKSSQEAVLATCLEGRVIIQTFCDHDYHREDMVPLWENYIYNTLKNHFLAIE